MAGSSRYWDANHLRGAEWVSTCWWLADGPRSSHCGTLWYQSTVVVRTLTMYPFGSHFGMAVNWWIILSHVPTSTWGMGGSCLGICWYQTIADVRCLGRDDWSISPNVMKPKMVMKIFLWWNNNVITSHMAMVSIPPLKVVMTGGWFMDHVADNFIRRSFCAPWSFWRCIHLFWVFGTSPQKWHGITVTRSSNLSNELVS